MQARALTVPDTYEFTPTVFPDDRGAFTSPFQAAAFTATLGHGFPVAQVNHSVSRRGVVRGVHFADVPPSQAKYVYCPRGRLLDVVVDIRVGSPTFGRWDAVELAADAFNAVYVAEGIGHAFVALEDDTSINYLCSTGYNPGGEHGINPLDTALNLPWPQDLELVLSDKDRSAPKLSEALDAGLLPSYAACTEYYAALRG
jgi:dTDP-4-dehydrorhamnose 3,5-epimerase